MPQRRKCVLNCSGYKKLFGFPDDVQQINRREQWLRLFGLDDKVPKMIFACERHFSDKMRCTKKLIQCAIPDINLPDSHTSSLDLRKSQQQLLESEEFVNFSENIDTIFDTVDPIGPNSKTDHLLAAENVLLERLTSSKDTEVQTDEALNDYVVINRQMIQKISDLKCILMKSKHEITKLRLHQFEPTKSSQLNTETAALEIHKRTSNDDTICEQVPNDAMHLSTVLELEDFNETTPKSVLQSCRENKVCGLIEVTTDKLYSMNCFYCSEKYPIWSWTHFVTHIKENHNNPEKAFINDDALETNGNKTKNSSTKIPQISTAPIVTGYQAIAEQTSINDDEVKSNPRTSNNSTAKTTQNNSIAIDSNDQMITEQIFVEEIQDDTYEESIVVETINVLSEFADNNEIMNEEFLEEEQEMADENDVYPQKEEETLQDSGIYREEEKDKYENITQQGEAEERKQEKDATQKADKIGVKKIPLKEEDFIINRDNISIADTDPRTMIQFLELLTNYPILWHLRRTSVESFDSAVAEVTDAVNLRWGFSMTTKGMHRSLTRIKLWYHRTVEIYAKNKEKIFLLERNKLTYFNKCAELDKNSKKITIVDQNQCQKHKRKAHNVDEITFKCNQCNMNFSRKDQLELHELTHLRIHQIREDRLEVQEDSYECEICGKRFRTKDIYRKHKLYHKPPKHKCELCLKLFFRPFTLMQHMKAHRNQRDFVCDICGKAFVRKAGMEMHKVTHFDAKPYACKICDTSFAVSSSLFRHQRSVHLALEGRIEDLERTAFYRKDVKIMFPKIRRYICNMCSIEFKGVQFLRDHNRNVHRHSNVTTNKRRKKA